MNRITRKEREAQIKTMAEDSLKEHQILKAEPGRWQVGRPNGSSVYRAEIIVTYQDGLIVHGDIDLVYFCCCSGASSPRGVVSWVANSNLDYLTTKAARGTGSEVCRCFDPEVALDDVMSQIEYSKKNPEDYSSTRVRPTPSWFPVRDWISNWEEIAEIIKSGGEEHEVQTAIFERIEDYSEYSVGICTTSRVIWAWHMVKKLDALLSEVEENQFRSLLQSK